MMKHTVFVFSFKVWKKCPEKNCTAIMYLLAAGCDCGFELFQQPASTPDLHPETFKSATHMKKASAGVSLASDHHISKNLSTSQEKGSCNMLE